jgi:hypothetical protein
MNTTTIYAVTAVGYGTILYFTKALASARIMRWLSEGYTVSERTLEMVWGDA